LKKKDLQIVEIKSFTTVSGEVYDIPLSYEVFGQKLGSAPIVLVNHAFTGNSSVAGESGWWGDIVGKRKIIDTYLYTVLAFNIPGNAYDGFFIENPENFTAKDIAKLFILGLEKIGIKKLFAIIGGSLGGCIGWEMLGINKDLSQNFIPIASDWKTSDWLYSQCMVQNFLLNQSEEPLKKARIHAMLTYRTPKSINDRFEGKISEEGEIRLSASWLNFHGNRLSERFTLSAYKMMNRLLSTVNVIDVEQINANIFIVSIDTDILFSPDEDSKTYCKLLKEKKNIHHFMINSSHGHDAFLIEYSQLNKILQNIFNNEKNNIT